MTEPVRLVFAGDSITDAGRDRTNPDSLGDGYVALLSEEFAQRGTPMRIVNVGIAGNRAVDLERRWHTDVATTAPDVLTVFIGVNDMWRRFDSGDPTTAASFEATYRRLLAAAVARRVILVEPFFLPVRDEQRAWIDDLDGKRAVVRRLAGEVGAALVPLHDVMTTAAAIDGPTSIAPDGVHPTLRGARLIADAWLEAYDAAPSVH